MPNPCHRGYWPRWEEMDERDREALCQYLEQKAAIYDLKQALLKAARPVERLVKWLDGKRE